MAVLTPSYAPDFELCRDLHRSVLRHAPTEVEHHLLVPKRDARLFAQLKGPRTRLHVAEDFLPKTFLSPPRLNYSINLRRPLPPIRGWIRQQILKLAAAAQLEMDVVIVADSDVEFIRPFSAKVFRKDDVVRFYRRPEAIDVTLPRHLIWHDVTRRLLGLPAATPPLPDYVAPLVACDPNLVSSMLRKVSEVTREPWTSAVGAELHFSEYTLYGVYIEEVADPLARSFVSDDSLCHEYWNEEPLDPQSAETFLSAVRPTDVAVMISAKSRTPLGVRRSALASARRELE
ncbi:DUF6492 family protein [Geodermatophilus africanus]|nr:DUF6492 family protein [Geodermatophilus africanus]